ncbi:hypothetical protein GK047_04825 [Paenibacillus sp. SYP-B3998]|uniref:Uncharacterized protein n=1 Tax=Paenibacillus sp. SYP-B3998 TaxID=2678564 RepID=A0A6G3ZTE8_9BACL|nr:hypothetical protein [Paenibacillus sp. SYP-B3998]
MITRETLLHFPNRRRSFGLHYDDGSNHWNVTGLQEKRENQRMFGILSHRLDFVRQYL